ncbi:VWA containing CoxE family protein [Brunnivagina elsteri]|uniref:VWA containing CoxE family protein n=1 Tax=Brunnivagina elsteri CCALA 953 TaxID=987040 RepID=A0A2A2TDL1_9CYAN|nr:VWA containing CoxE family protein [Calothrix elsteri]PAX51499.1 VWA containing CoxE family protein [Calothrix elsteri CCALA 953]
MGEFDIRKLLTRIFYRLRRESFNLGVSEYLAALDAIENTDLWGNSVDDLKQDNLKQDNLKQLIRLLWCSSLVEQNRLEMIWESIIATATPKEETKTSSITETGIETEESFSEEDKQIQLEQENKLDNKRETVRQQQKQEFAPQPVQAPFTPTELVGDIEFQNYWQLSRRYMVYSWRYLRFPVADGAEDVLDVSATVEQVAKQGFFLKPVYQRRESNHAHLLLLIDQEGSMAPFHRFTRDLVETAKDEGGIQRVDVGYFHNIPANSVYQDSHLTEPVVLEDLLASCDSETRVLIVSDGGAARGYRRMERVRAITDVIFDIKQHTSLIAWLNPMPKERWSNSSAQILSYIVPMYQMNQEGFSQAINTVQGQVWQPNR